MRKMKRLTWDETKITAFQEALVYSMKRISASYRGAKIPILTEFGSQKSCFNKQKSTQ